MTTRLVRAIVLVCLFTACKGYNPSGPGNTGTDCRTYPKETTITTSPIIIVPNATATDSFSTTTNRLTATILANGTPCTTNTYVYASTADFVDEAKVIPPLFYVMSQTSTGFGVCGFAVANGTYTYDSQRRLTRLAFDTGASTTYTAWDSYGRPISGTFSGGGNLTNVYNNSARTLEQTTNINGISTVTTTTHDANGNIVKTVVNGTGQTTTYDITQTTTVCK